MKAWWSRWVSRREERSACPLPRGPILQSSNYPTIQPSKPIIFAEQGMEQLYSEALGKFLADRFVTGTCPKCKYEVRGRGTGEEGGAQRGEGRGREEERWG